MSDLLYSKEFMNFGCLAPSKIMFDFLIFFVGREAFDPVSKGPAFRNFGIYDELYFSLPIRDNLMG